MSSEIKTHYAKFLEKLNTIAVINYKLVLGKEYDLLPTVIENQKQFIDSKISSISKYTGEISKDIIIYLMQLYQPLVFIKFLNLMKRQN
ncbi:hypothetical protein A1E_02860 [Rickettsia canadensis str. McKiel]|uniref:Uncharacterized protein n=1 Tax=Rickettsia canadensis (strain McKiel) TaxID=293613 RepID=A8EYS9_RICCK|nr:hypothetical protein A1E_02860 [Rickettsia canadensis str. McKiel]